MSDEEEPSVSTRILTPKHPTATAPLSASALPPVASPRSKFFSAYAVRQRHGIFVVIVHLAQDHPSTLAAILQASTSMPVSEVTRRRCASSRTTFTSHPAGKISGDGGRGKPGLPPSAPEVRAACAKPIDMFFAHACGRLWSQCDLRDSFGQRLDGTLGLNGSRKPAVLPSRRPGRCRIRLDAAQRHRHRPRRLDFSRKPNTGKTHRP